MRFTWMKTVALVWLISPFVLLGVLNFAFHVRGLAWALAFMLFGIDRMLLSMVLGSILKEVKGEGK